MKERNTVSYFHLVFDLFDAVLFCFQFFNQTGEMFCFKLIWVDFFFLNHGRRNRETRKRQNVLSGKAFKIFFV